MSILSATSFSLQLPKVVRQRHVCQWTMCTPVRQPRCLRETQASERIEWHKDLHLRIYTGHICPRRHALHAVPHPNSSTAT